MKLPVIADRFICAVIALKKRVEFYDIARIQTYLKALDLQIGLVINFGKENVEIIGVHA